jgi:hypothetical protein
MRKSVLTWGTLFAAFFIAISVASEYGQTLLGLGLVASLTAICVWSLFRARRRARRVPRGLCPRCEYDLRGNISGRCS